ncbi:enoyl-CoA hydratase/isomerase family protein [Rhodohalobacter halophilus]|uniref:enoyl-CoA hydratase/isomerase family protein n=1 Tax=Rhodohalobacter halophilus TaxID=1812810 RepID=UPI00083F7F03|nr:enoyl-CoA hydratase-related protein [Rhodohalobacter halophilus]
MKDYTFDTLLLETDENGIAVLTINRPDKLNALNNTVLDELEEAIENIEKDDDIRAVIVTGAGEKAFVAGADIKELNTLNKKQGEKQSERGQKVFFKIENCSKPMIAVVNGYALGGGSELAMACHIRIAEENAVFGLPEVGLGLIPGYGGTQRLPQLVGKSKAMEMILTGGQMKAEEAYQTGLAGHIAEPGKGVGKAKELAVKMLKNGPVALAKAIKAVNAGYRVKGFADEAEQFGELCETEDFKEGTSAFLEKRKPNFRGR